MQSVNAEISAIRCVRRFIFGQMCQCMTSKQKRANTHNGCKPENQDSLRQEQSPARSEMWKPDRGYIQLSRVHYKATI
jgi:hypothetical protein